MELMHVEHRELAINKYHDKDYNNNNKIGYISDLCFFNICCTPVNLFFNNWKNLPSDIFAISFCTDRSILKYLSLLQELGYMGMHANQSTCHTASRLMRQKLCYTCRPNNKENFIKTLAL